MASNCATAVTTIFLLFIFTITTFCEAQNVPAMYVFGDSVVDVGNNNYLASVLRADFAHNGVDYLDGKATGRFSNGKNSADFLAEKLGLSASPPYLSFDSNSNNSNAFLAGVSFASGGAGILNTTNTDGSIILSKQVEYYSGIYEALVKQLGSSGANDHFSKSLFPIVIGSNDIFGYFKSDSDLPNNYTPQQYIDLMISSLQQILKQLYGIGARKFLVTGIGAIGCCPTQRIKNTTEDCNSEMNFWSNKYSNGLKSMLQGLKSEHQDIHYSFFHTYSLFINLINKPATYGFTEVKAACCGLGNLNAKVPCTPISSYCSDRGVHLFWDFVHPTQKAASIIVEVMFSGSQQYVTPMNVKQLAAL